MTHNSSNNRIYNIKTDSLEPPKLENVANCEETVDTKLVDSKLLETTNNTLSGLLAHYDSDSDQEEVNNQETNKLDAKVDNFLQEINNLSPAEANNKVAPISAWQECFDEGTGYPYYWNVRTNQVTWDMPVEYKEWLAQNTMVSKTIDKPVKIIDKIVDKAVHKEIEKKKKTEKFHKKIVKKPSSDSEDEKIVMITSFSEDSSGSENEKLEKSRIPNTADEFKTEEISPMMVLGPHIEDIPKTTHENIIIINKEENKKEIIECLKEENVDETVILSRLRTQAKVLQELDGVLPEAVDKLLNSLDKNDISQSLSLVAGYGDDSDVEEDTIRKSIFPFSNDIIVTNEPIISTNESTLFPITEPIDVKQFELPEDNVKTAIIGQKDTEIIAELAVDTKAFKRKKRIGIALDVLHIKPEKKIKISEEPVQANLIPDERKGFGFKCEPESTSNDAKICGVSFKKSGIAFVKADAFIPTCPVPNKEDDCAEHEDKIENLEKIQATVNEKVNFLCEGKAIVSAVQIMSIQLKTLEAAHKAGGLSEKYLYSWLRETDTELAKLEQDAAPEGWNCQWDRSNGRYFYRNQQTGETQWNYPERDIIGGGEAMDICTTPPPNDEIEMQMNQVEPVAPSPPKIRDQSPSPPPPPIITSLDKDVIENDNENLQPPLPPLPPAMEVTPPPPPPPSISLLTQEQPLPPGVDSPDPPYVPVVQNELNIKTETTKRDSFGSELDSFYSDIALLEATTSTSIVPDPVKIISESLVIAQSVFAQVSDSIVTEISVKKKKKSKQKLGQGITMKKKAVSTLVEKWKKVQNDYM